MEPMVSQTGKESHEHPCSLEEMIGVARNPTSEPVVDSRLPNVAGATALVASGLNLLAQPEARAFDIGERCKRYVGPRTIPRPCPVVHSVALFPIVTSGPTIGGASQRVSTPNIGGIRSTIVSIAAAYSCPRRFRIDRSCGTWKPCQDGRALE
jgi:hypothetical protein